MNFKIGDYVKYKPGRGLLRCGCGQYDRAVVVSMSPFTLVSEWGDMLWQATVEAENFEYCGEVPACVMTVVNRRLSRERSALEAAKGSKL